jgi:hypothetical protein
MGLEIGLTPQEMDTLKEVTRSHDASEAVTKAARGYLRLLHLQELKSATGKVEFDLNWQQLEARELGEANDRA